MVDQPDAPIYHALAPEPANYDGPIKITANGTYSGAWQSNDEQAAVIIATTEAVILENCFVRAAKWGIREGAPGINLTVRDCQFRATPGGDTRAIAVASASNLLIENNYLEGVGGMTIYSWWVESTPTQTLRVLRNRAKNISTAMSNFIQVDRVRHLKGAEIAWNEVINLPDQRSVEDNINIHNSGGSEGSPLRIHNNIVWGAYPVPATSGTFTGTGITTDGDNTTAETASAFVHAYENHFVGTCNAGMNIASGHDILYENNRLITSARLADATALNATHAGVAIFDFYEVGSEVFYNNRIINNTIGFVSPGYNAPYQDRHDVSVHHCTGCEGNVSLPDAPITYATEVAEHERWQAKVKAAGLVVGPR
ncbi:MAG: hypothetical protein H0U74_13900 [Bradymonadaceae bacterium]|nr:hypothetical protein [Lujinxingiaceae bacterium]